MKRFLLCLLLLLLLCGCSFSDEAMIVTPHTDSSSRTTVSNAVSVTNYAQLHNAILTFVKDGQAEGTIHASNYDGDVEQDLAEAAYAVSKEDPLGAYAVDYMTHDCTLIVNYYEIHIRITFRRTVQEMDSIGLVATQQQLQERLQKAVEELEPRIVLRLSAYREQDIAGMVAEFCASNPETVIEQPTVNVTTYPEEGSIRILEIDLTYAHSAEELQAKRLAVGKNLDAAAEYIRYRQTDRDKAQLLYTYLTERFSYAQAETVTPLYDALCGGVADALGLAQAWQLICQRADMECLTVSGSREGQVYTWNIVELDGVYRHLDLNRCILEFGELIFLDDSQMEGYYWNQELYPVCEPPVAEPEPPTEETAPAEAPETLPPVEEPPEEEPPAEEPPEEEPPEEETPEEEPPTEAQPETEEPSAQSEETELPPVETGTASQQQEVL